jgi:Zn-dependent protease with chaperone function
MPTVWALSLVENFHRELDRQARERVIGGSWRDGYEINLRQLLRTARRWRYFVDQEAGAGKSGGVPEARQRLLLAREAYSLYGGMMRTANERAGVFRMLDQALGLHAAGVRSADDLTVRPTAIEDLGDSIRIGDVTLPKGPGGPFVPKPNKDYLADAVVLGRLYEYAKALALGEPLLLMGDSAAGKTSDLEYLFFRLNRNLRYKNLDSDTAIEEVIGGFAPGDRKGTFTFQEGMIPKAMEEGTGAFLDEFNLNPLVEWLNTVIDDGKLYLPHRIVDGRAMIVAAANPPDPRYPGRVLLSAATRSRYTERWVDIDKSPARLTDLMSHWLKGGAVYGLLAVTLPSLHAVLSGLNGGGMGSFALGRYQKQEGFPWMLLGVAGTAYFFAAAAAHFGNPIGFFAAIAAVWTGIIMSDKAKRRDAGKPLAAADLKELQRLVDARGWQGTHWSRVLDDNHATRALGIDSLGQRPFDDDTARMLEILARAETTAGNVSRAIKTLGDNESSEAIPALERLKTALPPEFASQVAAALAHARSRRLEAPSGELANLAVSPAAPTRAQDAFSRAASAAAALQAKGDLASRLRAKALTEKAAELSAADGDANQSAILLRQLEDLLAAPVGGDGGSAAAGRSWLSRLKGAFGSKKKAPEAVDRGASAPSGDDEAPARAPTLEELLRARGVPEKDWPSVRAKVDRVQTIIQMVGGSVGRDGSTRWAPGDLWAFFPDENTVTYPFEDLLTHSEEELVGLTDHEGGHRDITVLDQRLPLVKKYFGDPVKHFLWNGFEDPRVNNWDIKRMPGAARYLHAAYDRYLPEDLEARPTNDAPDLSSPQGDGASAFSPEALQYPHIEFVMAGNYYWRYGKKPPKFHNKSAEKAFDQALPEIEKIFRNYPQRTDPDQKERAAYSYDTLKRIDETLLPLYEPLVAESQKKMARQMSGKGKDGKGQGQSQNGKGKSGAGAMPPQEQKGQSKPDPNGKDKKPGDAKDQSKDPQGEPLDPQALKEALEKLQEHARKAAEELGGKIEEKPTNKDIREALKKKGLTPGSEAPKPLTLQDIAQTQREQLVNRQASAFDRAFAPVAHLSGAMVTHLENIFLKNSRPRDEGWYRTGKRPDVKQFMKRQGEGGLRDDYMLRRAARTKRKYKVTLLIDASGSMAAHAVETSRTAVLLAESLTRLQIDVEIILFSNVARVVKSFEQPMTPQNRDAIAEDFRALIGSLGNGMTHDADALTQSLERLRAQDGDRKFVFVVTDGAGNGPSKLSDALAQAARDQVFVMGVGIGAGMETYVKANYPRHATVSTVDELPLKLKQELERYISEQELSPRARASFVPQGQGTDPGSRALGRPYPSLALQALSVAVAAGFAVGLLGLMALAPWPVGLFIGSPLTGLLLLWSRGRGFWLVEAAYLTAAATVFYLLMGHSGRFSALWAALIIGPAALKMFGHRLAGRYAPLEPALKAEVRAALAGTRGAEGLYGWRPARLKALDAVSGAKAGLFTKPLALLAERDPAEDVRLRAVEILSHHAAADDEALEALRRAARAGGEAGALARRRLDAALKTRAETAAKTIDLETLTAPAAPSRAEDSAETRARAFLASAEDGGLAGRLRREAVAEALRQLEAAKAAGGGDESAVAERRLRDLLDAGASGGAAGSQALPAPRGGWRLFLERRLPTSFVAWLGVMKWSLGFTTGAWALAALVPGLKALQGVLLIGGLFGIFGPGKGPRSHIIARAGIFAFLVSMFLTAPVMGSGMGWVVWGCFNMLAAVGTVEKTLPGIVERWGAPNRMARWAILRSGTKGLSPRQRWWRRALAGSARARDAAAAEMLAAPSEVPGVQAPLLALSSHAADKMTPELVEVLVRLRTPEADSALTILSMMKAAPASKWAQEALARRAAAESAPLPQLLEPAKPDADARTLSAARAELEKPAETLSARLRAQALTEAVTAVEGSSGDERRLALERLRALLEDPAGDAGGAAASGGAPRLRLPLWSALGAAALALGLAAGPAIAALVALSPLAAAGAGAAGGALVARSLSRPLDFRDARAAVGPREISRDIPEWARAQRALLRLTARLGAAPEQAPSLALWSDEPGSARPSWDGWSGGVGVNARSVVAVGERWLTAAELELEGLIAHELGHLATGELRWRALWSRLHRAARWAALAAPALIPVAGWLWPALAAAAWAASGLLGLAFLRRAELRADKFAAKLAGPDAARAFLARLAAEAPETPGVSGRLLSLFSDHPTLERRRAALGKPPR